MENYNNNVNIEKFKYFLTRNMDYLNLEKTKVEEFIFSLNYYVERLKNFIEDPQSIDADMLFGDDMSFIREEISNYSLSIESKIFSKANYTNQVAYAKYLIFAFTNHIIQPYKICKHIISKCSEVLEIIKYKDNKLDFPIDSQEKYDLIDDVVKFFSRKRLLDLDFDELDFKFKFNTVQSFMLELASLDLNAKKYRDKLFEEKKRKIAKRKIRRNIEKQVIEKDQDKSEIQIIDLEKEIEYFKNKLGDILIKYKNTINHDYSEDIDDGFEIIKNESSEEKDYFLSSKLDVCLGIVFKDIEFMLSNNFELTNEYCYKLKKAFDTCEVLLPIKDFDIEHNDELNKAQESINNFYNLISEEERNILISIYEHISNINFASSENMNDENTNISFNSDDIIDDENNIYSSNEQYRKQEMLIKDFISNVSGINTKIDYNFYRMYECIVNIEKYLKEYDSEVDLNNRKYCLKEINLLIKNYSDLLEIKQIIETRNNVRNDIYYLYLDDGVSSMIEYILDDKKHINIDRNFSIVKGLVNKIRNLSDVDIHRISGEVLGSYNNGSVRRNRDGNYRITFIHINRLGKLNIELERSCYIVIACGFKKADKTIYDFTKSRKVTNALEDLYMYIKRENDKIDAENLTEEEKKSKIKSFISDIVTANNKKFEEDFETEIEHRLRGEDNDWDEETVNRQI